MLNQDLSDQWFEGYIKPSLGGVYTTASDSEFYGKVSAAGERTYGAVPEQFGYDISSFGPDDLYIGWRSGKSLDIGENAVDVQLGRAPFKIGQGFLLGDGAPTRRGRPSRPRTRPATSGRGSRSSW